MNNIFFLILISVLILTLVILFVLSNILPARDAKEEQDEDETKEE